MEKQFGLKYSIAAQIIQAQSLANDGAAIKVKLSIKKPLLLRSTTSVASGRSIKSCFLITCILKLKRKLFNLISRSTRINQSRIEINNKSSRLTDF